MNSQSIFNSILESTGEVGYVEGMTDALIRVSGLPHVKTGETVLFESGAEGFVYSIAEYYVEVVLLSDKSVSISEKVAHTKEPLAVSLAADLLGKSLDARGRPLHGDIDEHQKVIKQPIFKLSPSMLSRLPVTKPLMTKISIVDIVIPLGHGQRELIVGDRKTGKTQFLLQLLSSQLAENVVCIYCGIAKRDVEIKEITEGLKKAPHAENIIVIASSARESIGKIYITPFTAMTIAEYFRDLGRNVVLILDDLSTHAQFYREMALLARRFPGRSSYPGDIFHLHAQLMERAGNFKIADGREASITCLPIATSILGDLAGFITTNLMSMTDGHIYIDKEIFDEGRRPALNPFLSVTRVGHQTQNALVTDVSREVTSFLIEHRRAQNYSHFGNEVSAELKTVIMKGNLVYSLFDQDSNVLIPSNLSLYLLAHIWAGNFREISGEQLKVSISALAKKFASDSSFKNAVDGLMSKVKTFRELTAQIATIPL